MKNNDTLICIKNHYYSGHQIFIKNKKYKISYIDEIQCMIFVVCEHFGSIAFSYDINHIFYVYNYFTTNNIIRKYKLNRILHGRNINT